MAMPVELDQLTFLQLQINQLKKRLDEIDGTPYSRRKKPVVAIMRPLKVRQVIQGVANENGVSFAAVVSHSRSRTLVASRRQVILQLREMGFTLQAIGRWMGIDHSTVHHHEMKARGL